MKLPKLAIENHQFTIIIVIILVIFGVLAFLTMPRSEDPQVSPPGTSIIAIYPGANPADMEELVSDPIEEVVNELEDIKKLTSKSENGLAVIAVEFISGSDPDDKYSDVVQKVNSVRNKLPANLLMLETEKWSISDVNILQLALVSETENYRELEKEAEVLKKMLEKVYGVKRVKTWAFPEQEVRVSIDLQKLAKLGIPLKQVIGSLQAANQNIPGGNLDIGGMRYNVQTSGTFDSIDDIGATVIHGGPGKMVHLRDLASIKLTYEDVSYLGRYNGKRAVFITATQKTGTNIFEVRKGLQLKIDEFESTLPASIHLEFAFDQSLSVRSRVNGFFLNLMQGLILVGLVVFFAVSVRASIIVMLVIPLSILTGLGFLDLSGNGLQQMSIAGFVIALGLLVDNAIVVTENISRFLKMGKDAKTAAVEGTSQIAWAVVSSTVTTVLAFVPVMMMGEVTGEFIRSMPLTVVFTLIASLFFSLTFTPFLARKFIRIEKNGGKKWLRIRLNKVVENQYRRTLGFSLKRPVLIIVLMLVVFIGSLGLFPLVGVSFFPKAEKPQFIININTPDGTSLNRTNEIAKYVEAELQKEELVQHYVSNVGHGNPRIYYNVISERTKATHAQIFVNLREWDLEKFYDLIGRLRSEFSRTPGVKINVKEFEQGPPVEAPIAIRVLGENLAELKKISLDVEEMIKQTSGTINVNNPLSTSKTDLHVDINRDKAALFGVSLLDADQTVRAALAGLTATKYRDEDGKEYNIVVRLPIKNYPKVSDFERIYIPSRNGAQIPLNQIAEIKFKSTPMLISHYNMERNVTITADVIGKTSVDEATRTVIEKLDKYNWKKGYRYAIGGEMESRGESFGGMMKAVIIAIIAILGVLVLQFRSYIQPFIVFSAIPLAIIGSIIALLITGNSFSFSAFIGLTSLVGIVVNNSIILVDYTNQLRNSGKKLLDALKEAAETRFIPIILTTATTIGGLLPLTLGGGSMWAPMGWTIIGGLVASTFLTLILVPVLYKLFSR